MLSLLLRRGDAGSHSALRLLDDASEALQYNRDLLQSALDQVRHGLSVFDKDMRLICWNRQFRELLNLPAELGRVGAPLDRILRTCAERGDFGAGDVNKLVADRLMKLAVAHETFQEQVDGGRRILEIRTSPMPQGGIVTTYSDITERVDAREALARANETLERRVTERTAELTEVNEALAVAKRKADEANLDKTRFLAAASHDVLQPLNAARLYATSLVERQIAGSGGQACAQHRCLAGGGGGDPQRPDRDFAPRRRPAGARHHGVPAAMTCSSAWRWNSSRSPARKGSSCASCRRGCGCARTGVCCAACCRTSLSNAIKYTPAGKVLLGVRRRGGNTHRAGVRHRARHPATPSAP